MFQVRKLVNVNSAAPTYCSVKTHPEGTLNCFESAFGISKNPNSGSLWMVIMPSFSGSFFASLEFTFGASFSFRTCEGARDRLMINLFKLDDLKVDDTAPRRSVKLLPRKALRSLRFSTHSLNSKEGSREFAVQSVLVGLIANFKIRIQPVVSFHKPINNLG